MKIPKLLRLKHAMLFSFFISLIFNSSCKEDKKGTEIEPEVPSKLGCVDPYATNFNEEAEFSDNTCSYSPVACADCDYVIENDEHTVDNDVLKLPAGAVIGIKGGDRKPLTLLNFNGEGAGFIFTNCDGTASISLEPGSEAVRIRNSSFLRFTGTGSTDDFGIQISAGSQGIHGYEKVSDIEIDHVKISDVDGIGIWIVTRPTCDGDANYGNFVQKNTKIHHNSISHCEGEGMYIGPSKWDSGFDNNGCPGEKLKQADLKGVEIFNNIVDSPGWDGIQVGGAVEDCKIYKNVVLNYGTEEVGLHQAGLMINPGTVGEIFGNYIEGGTGNAMHLLGFDNLVYSNIIMNCKQNAIHTGDRNPLPNKSYRIYNNTIINVEGRAFHMNSRESVDNVFENNFMANIVDEELFVSEESNTSITNNVMAKSLEGYPFSNIEKLDFTPALSSVLLDSGKVVDRDELLVDFFLLPRLAGDDLDIGACENQEAEKTE